MGPCCWGSCWGSRWPWPSGSLSARCSPQDRRHRPNRAGRQGCPGPNPIPWPVKHESFLVLAGSTRSLQVWLRLYFNLNRQQVNNRQWRPDSDATSTKIIVSDQSLLCPAALGIESTQYNECLNRHPGLPALLASFHSDIDMMFRIIEIHPLRLQVVCICKPRHSNIINNIVQCVPLLDPFTLRTLCTIVVQNNCIVILQYYCSQCCSKIYCWIYCWIYLRK